MDIDVFRARIDVERKTIKHDPPPSLSERCTVTRTTIKGSPCYTLHANPQSAALSDSHVTKLDGPILYLHGGCYVFEITPHHWQFCAWLAETFHVDVVVPIYPLAPEHKVDEVLAMVEGVYQSIAGTECRRGASATTSIEDDHDGGAITIMGDSAGGGMALALAQRVEKKPKHVVLLSPWVDITMSHEGVPKADKRDPWLSKNGLVEAGHMYRGDAVKANDPRVSPMHGSLENIGLISIYIGTRDVLHPDAVSLRDRAPKNITLFEYEEMVHDFMLIDFLPEAKAARADLVKQLAG